MIFKQMIKLAFATVTAFVPARASDAAESRNLRFCNFHMGGEEYA